MALEPAVRVAFKSLYSMRGQKPTCSIGFALSSTSFIAKRSASIAHSMTTKLSSVARGRTGRLGNPFGRTGGIDRAGANAHSTPERPRILPRPSRRTLCSLRARSGVPAPASKVNHRALTAAPHVARTCHRKSAAPFKRNDAMLETLPIGVIVFAGLVSSKTSRIKSVAGWPRPTS